MCDLIPVIRASMMLLNKNCDLKTVGGSAENRRSALAWYTTNQLCCASRELAQLCDSASAENTGENVLLPSTVFLPEMFHMSTDPEIRNTCGYCLSAK